MAQLTVSYRSSVLQMCTMMNVILPEVKEGFDRPLSQVPVLTLLHGLSDDCNAWTRESSIARYADKYNIAVVMPSGDRVFYNNTPAGRKYFDHIANEVPEFCSRMFGLSRDPKLNYIAGLSMGGFGSFKIALAYPERYTAAGSFSGAVDIVALYENPPLGEEEIKKEFKHTFGCIEDVKSSINDLPYMLKKRATEKAPLPRLYQYCGTEDFLYNHNIDFKNLAQELGVDLTYVETPGDHTWQYWDSQVIKFLEFIEL